MKIAVYYDTLVDLGGAENHALALASCLNADIITSGYNNKIYDDKKLNLKIINIGNFSNRFNKSISFIIENPIRFFLNKGIFQYDIHIFIGASSIFAAKKENINIWCCTSPNRNIYDLKKTQLKDLHFINQFIFKLYCYFFEYFDKRIINNNFQYIYSTSRIVQKRVMEYYKRNTEIIYPPVVTKNYRFKKIGDYYLLVGRLYKVKRVSLVVDAFLRLLDKKLLIVGDGPERKIIEAKIADSNNIELLSVVNDAQLIELYSNCKAVIYLPKNEDFGLVPVEAMASGKICIGADEGGCRETILHNKTGFLIEPTVENLVRIVDHVESLNLYDFRRDCIDRASQFDIEIFKSKWIHILKDVMGEDRREN